VSVDVIGTSDVFSHDVNRNEGCSLNLKLFIQQNGSKNIERIFV